MENLITAEERDRLVAALRSGDYKQARHSLRVGDAYCCIGVQCRLRGIDIPNHAAMRNVYDESGIAFDDRGAMILMNDNKRLSFVEIADWVEKHLTVKGD